METTVENHFPFYRFMSQEQKFIFLLSHTHPQVNHSVSSFIGEWELVVRTSGI